MTDEGKRTGKWVELLDNGKIDIVRYYVPAFSTETEKKLFFYKAPFDSDTINKEDTVSYIDTISSYQKLFWADKYEYRKNGKLKRIVRKKGSQDPVYFYGPNREISLKKDYLDYHLDFNERIGTIKTVAVEIENNSDNTLSLIPRFENNCFSTDRKKLVLPPKQSSSFTFNLSIEPEDNNYTVILENDSISINILLKTFGYHVKSADVANGGQLLVKNHFIYMRTGSEALFKLYDQDRSKLLRTGSLAKEKTTINLEGIKPGEYWMCVKNFSADKENCTELKIER